MAGSALASVGGAIAGRAVGGLLGGKSGSRAAGAAQVAPTMFNVGGLYTDIPQGRLTITTRPERRELLDNIKGTFLSGASGLRDNFAPRFQDAFQNGLANVGGLIDQVRPGFGRLTDARVQANNNARERTISNLSDNLARRRVSGSSFAQDSITRAENEFAQQESEIRAESFLQELQLTSELQQRELDISLSSAKTAMELYLSALDLERQSTEVDLNEENTKIQIAQNLINGIQQQANRNAQLNAEGQLFDARSAAGFGGLIGSSVSDGIGDILNRNDGRGVFQALSSGIGGLF